VKKQWKEMIRNVKNLGEEYEKRNKNRINCIHSGFVIVWGMSYYIGTQVFMGSTQLVTCEDTSFEK